MRREEVKEVKEVGEGGRCGVKEWMDGVEGRSGGKEWREGVEGRSVVLPMMDGLIMKAIQSFFNLQSLHFGLYLIYLPHHPPSPPLLGRIRGSRGRLRVVEGGGGSLLPLPS